MSYLVLLPTPPSKARAVICVWYTFSNKEEQKESERNDEQESDGLTMHARIVLRHARMGLFS